jgi:flagellin
LGSNVIINGGQIYAGSVHIDGETAEAVGSGDYKLSDSTVTINGSGYTDTTGVSGNRNAYREILYPSSGSSGTGGANITTGANIPTGNGLWIQTGASTANGFHLSIDKMDAVVLGVKPLDVGSHSAASAAIGKVNKAIETLSTQRSKIGAQQNRLEYVYNVDLNSAENLQNSESKIRDADMAKEMVTFSKQSVLEQASQAMLAQANQSSNGILQLLS